MQMQNLEGFKVLRIALEIAVGGCRHSSERTRMMHILAYDGRMQVQKSHPILSVCLAADMSLACQALSSFCIP